jgi:flagellar basal body-associated protein FliL
MLSDAYKGRLNMAEKAEKKAEAPAKPEAEKKAPPKAEAAPKESGAPVAAKGGLLTKTPVLLGGVMLIEAVVLFAGFKFIMGGAKNANAADLTTPVKKEGKEGADGDKSASQDPSDTTELQLLAARFPNKRSGHTFLYDVKIVLSVKKDSADKVKAIVGNHDALIQDRVRTIIAESDPDKLGGGAEPGLETLRRQVKYQLDEIVGDGLIDDVLIPQCIPFPADY